MKGVMVGSKFLQRNSVSGRPLLESFRGFLLFMFTFLTFVTTLFIFLYISSTSAVIQHHPPHLSINPSLPSSSSSSSNLSSNSAPTNPNTQFMSLQKPPKLSLSDVLKAADAGQTPLLRKASADHEGTKKDHPLKMGSKGNDSDEVFHDRDVFMESYKDMNGSLKIYVYPVRRGYPFANVLLPVKDKPGGNYASESYFKKALMGSHFVTQDAAEADLFYLPFSIASMRHDKRIGVGGIKNFIRDYIHNISRDYPHWNRTGGADHFYVACHSIGKTAMEKAVQVKINAIQLVCSSNYFIHGYVPHKDASLPQIWPRPPNPPSVPPSKRKKLAFFAGAMNSPVRQKVVQHWRNDTEIFVHSGRLKTPYADQLLRSKFCLHVKGFEVNTARIGDALYYGCVPVILADHYDLPFADILDWRSFSLVVTTLNIPLLKTLLQEVSFDKYMKLQSNVLKVRTHFQWNTPPVQFDAFYMVMYELWLRRSCVRLHL